MNKLKPCPFCGASAHKWSWNGGTRIDCSSWESSSERTHYVGIGAKTEQEAIEAWNKRVGDQVTNEEISKWLMNLKDDIGKTQYQPLWHYAEALDMAIKALEQPEQWWIPVTKEQILQAGYEGREARFHIGGRLFAIRELAQ